MKEFEDWLNDYYPTKYDALKIVDEDFTYHDLRHSYEAGYKKAKDQWELDKIAIHEYYDAKIRELMGTETPEVPEGNGKLT
jgi:hypothetical protein